VFFFFFWGGIDFIYKKEELNLQKNN